MPTNGLFGELYLKVTMFSGHGWNHDSPTIIYDFYLAYGSDEEILDHCTNKLNQDLDKACDLMVKLIRDIPF